MSLKSQKAAKFPSRPAEHNRPLTVSHRASWVRTTLRSHAGTSVLKQERGAISVFAVFMSLFLVAGLYYVIGLGETLLYRQAVQNSADAGVFSAAVVHARGMNLLALINMVMAAVLAVLVGLRSVQMLAAIGAAISASICPIFPVACGFVGPLKSVESAARQAFERSKPVIVEQILPALHQTAEGIALAMPALAQARTQISWQREHGDIVTFGIVTPIYESLPVEDGDPKDLCQKAGEYAGELVGTPFEFIGSGRIKRAIGGAMGKATRHFSELFCGLRGSSLKDDETEELAESVFGVQDDILNTTENEEEELKPLCPDEKCQKKAIQDSTGHANDVLFDNSFAERTSGQGSNKHQNAKDRKQRQAVPMQVLPAAKLGTERYQLRAAVVGNNNPNIDRETAERLAQNQEPSLPTWMNALPQRLQVAQAEYYYHGDHPRKEWLWRMHWRARFRRFRFARDDGSSFLSLSSFLVKHGGEAVQTFEEHIVH